MLPAEFKPHELVTKRDGDGTVGFVLSADPTLHAGEFWYRVQFGAGQENCRQSDLRRHANTLSLAALLSSDMYGGPDAFRRHTTAVKLQSKLTDTLYSYGASRTQLHPYQFVPLLKFLASPYGRVLIADEVGLGKTIEAGYILQETMARDRAARVLVVCPASLCLKWLDELYNRFGHRFDLLDAAGARQRIPMSGREGRSSNPLRGIVSLESIRNDRFIQAIASGHERLALLIVDEAHHCRNTRTLQARAVSALVEHSDSVVFLSATPVQTSELNLFALLNMLVPEEFPSEAAFRQRLSLNRPIVEAESLLRRSGPGSIPAARARLLELGSDPDAGSVTANPLFVELLEALGADEPDTPSRRVALQEQISQMNLLSNVFTRTKRRDVQVTTAQRKAVIPEATLTADEQDAYDTISDFIFEEYQARNGDGAAQLVLSTYQRQLASSIPAAVRKFRDAIECSTRRWRSELEATDEQIEAERPDDRYRPVDDPAFREIILGVDIPALEACDTKYGLLIGALRRQHALVATGERESRKTLVFSYFRRSLDYLERRLVLDGFSVVRIDGGVKSTPGNPDTDERGKRISRFRDDPRIEIMLTSEVGSEGLDFQFCDSLVNWDLPWNPMVVEQRIGRLDRIGQKSSHILIVNLACEGTIEARILHRLYERIGIFERSIGELEPILGDLVRELEAELFRPRLTAEDQERIIHRREMAIETQRRRQQSLEQKAEMLIGHDEFFRAKLDRIRRFGRYVGGDELRLFAENELRAIAPGLAFETDGATGVYRLAYRAEVERVVDAALPKGDEEGLRFLTAYRRATLRCAFDGEIADRHARVEPLHAQHPLIRALTLRLEDALTHQAQVVALSVPSRAVPPGPWFVLWALIVETGFLAAKSLLCSVIDLSGESLIGVAPEASDQLLADMVRDGRPWADFNPPAPADAESCLQAGEQEIRERVDALHHRRSARMEAIKAARSGTVEATFRVRIERQRERLSEMEQRAMYEPGAQKILPAYRATLQNLEDERTLQLDRIDELRLGAVTYTVLGAGFVHVLEPVESVNGGQPCL